MSKNKSENNDLESIVDDYLDTLGDGEFVESEEPEDDDDELRELGLLEARDTYLDMIDSDGYADATIQSHEYRINKFLAWLAVNGVEHTLDIEPHHFHDYKQQRAANVKKTTVKTHLNTVRVFIRRMEDMLAVPEGMSEYVRPPSLKGSEGQRSDYIEIDRGDHVMEYLRKYHYASYEHVFFELMWAVGLRLGSIHSLDVSDVYDDDLALEVRHRPEQGTTLKNQEEGERDVGVTEQTMKAIQDYIHNPDRPDTTDDYGREPLFASPMGGRMSKSHLRNVCYWATVPCVTGQECEWDADGECRWAANRNKSSQCPSSKSPHAIRSGALTRQIKEGINPQLISERANVSVDILHDHYNELDKRERMQVRREWFDDEFAGRDAEEQVFGDTDSH